jgi:hypothetical protein
MEFVWATLSAIQNFLRNHEVIDDVYIDLDAVLDVTSEAKERRKRMAPVGIRQDDRTNELVTEADRPVAEENHEAAEESRPTGEENERIAGPGESGEWEETFTPQQLLNALQKVWTANLLSPDTLHSSVISVDGQRQRVR